MAASVPRNDAIFSSSCIWTSSFTRRGQHAFTEQRIPSWLTDRSVESWRPTAAQTVFPHSLDSSLLDALITCETGKIVASEDSAEAGAEMGSKSTE